PAKSISGAISRLLLKVRSGDIILIPSYLTAGQGGGRHDMAGLMPELLTELVIGLKTIGLRPWGLKALIG
ncbi:MAG: hypothetical protein ACP5J5_07565, partial [Dissulfurimicrobium sp.]